MSMARSAALSRRSAAMQSREPDEAQTGAKALFGMRARFEDQFAQRRRRRSDPPGVGADEAIRDLVRARLTSQHDPITSNRWRSPQANSNTECDGTRAISTSESRREGEVITAQWI
jgi:hypothetical protein